MISLVSEEHTSEGHAGEIFYRVWPNPDAARVVILAHGYGEHIGRYEHVAAAFGDRGALVAGPDHVGHGQSAGERVLMLDYEAVIDDLHGVIARVRTDHTELPVVLVGHSMGGLIAARYAQRHGSELAGLVLSAPVLGSWVQATDLLALEEIPDDPLPPETLSRDPEVGAAYTADELVWHGPFKRPTLESLALALATVNEASDIGDLPTLWIHGDADQLVPIAQTREGIGRLGLANLREIVYPGARHEVFNETNSDEVLAATADFIDAVAPAD